MKFNTYDTPHMYNSQVMENQTDTTRARPGQTRRKVYCAAAHSLLSQELGGVQPLLIPTYVATYIQK
eukprot:6172318-Ditylum_brightwellii.AAC.1